MPQKTYSARPVLTVNLRALTGNYLLMKKLAAPARVAACVKANAYGLGLEQVGRALYGVGCRIFFVAQAQEGAALRKAIGRKSSIYVLSGPTPYDRDMLFGQSLKPVINSLAQARLWQKTVAGVKHPPRTALHFDTGMNRLGLAPEEVKAFLSDKTLLAALDVDLVMSHLACAPDPAHELNAQQLSRFKNIAGRLPPLPMSLANSGGVFLGRDYHFKLVRPGIALYGGQATLSDGQKNIRPVANLSAPVLQVRHVRAGQGIGYNAAFIAPSDMRLAILSLGYADGLPTTLSGTNEQIKIYARLAGKRVPVVGRISMDTTIVDITHLKTEVSPGDKAFFLGRDLTALAKAAGLIDYEILTGLGARCRRVYVTDEP